jgi:hypothetical protein
MRLNTSPSTPLGKPCMRDMANLIAPTGLLPANVVPLMPLKHLKRRIREINAKHPHFQEETPLVLAYETRRRKESLGGQAEVFVNQAKVA